MTQEKFATRKRYIIKGNVSTLRIKTWLSVMAAVKSLIDLTFVQFSTNDDDDHYIGPTAQPFSVAGRIISLYEIKQHMPIPLSPWEFDSHSANSLYDFSVCICK